MPDQPDGDDHARFTALYEQHYPRVYAYLASRAGRELAEEAASETFCVAWRRFHQMPAAQLPWLIGVARNVLRDSYRATLRSDRLSRELRAWADGAEVVDVADGVVERAEVLRALAVLPDGERELLTLVAWHGLTAAQAARVLGCSKPAYFVRLHRARRRLERLLSTAGPAVEEESGLHRVPRPAPEGQTR